MPFPFALLLSSLGGAPPLVLVSITVQGGSLVTTWPAGRASGGQVLNIVMTGLLGTPSVGAFGTVSGYVGGQTFSVTVAGGGVAGSTVNWTITDTSTGLTVANLEYTYTTLSPTLNTVTPAVGAGTLTNNARTFGCLGLPPAGSGCSVSATVGVGTTSSLVITSGSTCTANLSAPGVGSPSGSLTVDGVTGPTTSAIYTGSPVPTYTSIQSVFNGAGQTFNVFGTGFLAGAQLSASGGIGNITTTFVSATRVTGTLASAPGVGSYDLTLTNLDGQSVTRTNGLVVTAELIPATILAAKYVSEWDPATLALGLVSSWVDIGSNAYALAAAGTARPTALASSAHGVGLGKPCVTWDGVATTMSVSGVTFGTHTPWMFVVCYPTAVGTGCKVVQWLGGSQFAVEYTNGAKPETTYSTVKAVDTTAELNTLIAVTASVIGTGANAETANYNRNNLSKISTAGALAQPPTTGAVLWVGSNANANGFFAGEIFAIVLANADTTALQDQQMAAWANSKFGVNANMTVPVGGTTPISPSVVATGRIFGTGFDASCTITIPGFASPSSVGLPGTGVSTALSVTWPSLAAGSYDYVITRGSDGSQITVVGGLTVTATDDADLWTIFGTAINVIADPAFVTPNGSKILTFTDRAGIGATTITQPTGANQPPLTTADAAFNNLPSATFSGTPVTMATSPLNTDVASNTSYVLAVCLQSSTAATTDMCLVNQAGSRYLQFTTTGKPKAGPATWSGSAMGSTIRYVEGYAQGTGGATENYGVAVDFGVFNITAGADSQPVYPNNNFQLGSFADSNWLTGKIGKFWQLSRVPTGAERTRAAAVLLGLYGH